MRRRAPRPLALALRDARDSAAPSTPLARVQAAWPGAVGDAIAAAAEPRVERDGVITVGCESAAWASELELLQTELMKRLREQLGEGAPRGLRFVVEEPR